MIEKTVLLHLQENMAVPVYMERPEEIPERYVLIVKTGSSRTNFIDRATLAIQSYADTMAEAAALNEAVKKQMDCLSELPEVSRAERNSDYNDTDTITKQYRYQVVYDLVFFD